MAYSTSRTITIDNTKVSGSANITDFRFLFKSQLNSLRTTTNGGDVTSASGYDIIFSSDTDPGNKLDHEIIKYDASTGEFIAWVRIPTVTYNSDTVFYLLYGDSGVTTSQENKTGVWGSNYKAVHHLNDSLSDSKGVNNLTHSGTPAYEAGKISRALTFDSTSSEYAYVADSANNRISGDISTSAWIKIADMDIMPQAFQTKFDSGDNKREWVVMIGTAWTVERRFQTTYSQDGTSANTTGHFASDSLSTGLEGVFFHLVTIIDVSAKSAVYILNGSEITVTYNEAAYHATSIYNNDAPYILGSRKITGSFTNFMNGSLEEVRLYSGLLDVDTVKTEYANQNSPSTFYSLSGEPTTSSTSTSSTSTSTTTTAETTSTTTLPILDSEGAIIYGEENPTEGELKIEWSTWGDGSGGSPTVVGDADWGKLALNTGDEARSRVRELPDAQARVFTLTENEYGTGQGTATLQIRGHADTSFSIDDESPSWVTYTEPLERSWKYVQVRMIKSS